MAADNDLRPGARHPARVAIVGSGPAGFFVAERLLKRREDLEIDLFDRLPTPFGLVRGGVAPDHPKIKSVTAVFDRIARDPRVSFFGNVEVGDALPLALLREHYSATVIATGAPDPAKLGIEGEALRGVHTASDFVGWYNGHPDHRDLEFDFSDRHAVVIGHGNVAADVCRMLLTPVDELAKTDVAAHALECLSTSRVRVVHLVGRRGPAQAKFTNNELRELGEIRGCATSVDPGDLVLDRESERELAHPDGSVAARNVRILAEFAARPGDAGARQLVLSFCRSPTAFVGGARLAAVRLERNRLVGEAFRQRAVPTGDIVEIPCGLAFTSVGSRGRGMPGAPFDEGSATVPNDRGRVIAGGSVVAGLYVAGWIKRGATGIIGTNRADGTETADSLLSDLPSLAGAPKPGAHAIRALLHARGIRATDYADWDRIDRAEQVLGAQKTKPREKFTRVGEMLDLLRE